MFVSHLKIDSFGAMSNRVFGPFSDKLTIIYGKNEAGKTTIASFVKGILFGWENGRSKENTYKPENTDRSGSIFFKDKKDETVLTDSTKKELRRTKGKNGLSGDKSLIEDIDKDTFMSVFFLSSDELLQLSGTSEITTKLLTAGSGTEVSPAQALVAINKQISTYTSSSSENIQSLVNLKKKKSHLNDRISEAYHEAQQLKDENIERRELIVERQDTKQKLAQINAEINKISEAKGDIRRLNDRLKDAQNELDEMEEPRISSIQNKANYFDAPKLLESSTTQLGVIDSAITTLTDKQIKAEQRVEQSYNDYLESKTDYEAFIDDKNSSKRKQDIKAQHRAKAIFAIVIPALFLIAGAFLSWLGMSHRITMLFTVGIALLVCAAIITIFSAYMLFRKSPDKSLQEQEKEDSLRWVMLKDQDMLNSRKQDLEELKQEILNCLSEYGLDSANGSLKQARDLIRQARDIKTELDQAYQRQTSYDVHVKKITQLIYETNKQRTNTYVKIGLSEDSTIFDVDALIERKIDARDALSTRSLDLENRLGTIEAHLNQEKRSHTLDELEIQKQQVDTMIEESKRQLAKLLLARRILQLAIVSWQSKSQPEVYKQASRLMSMMTNGRWIEIIPEHDGHIYVMDAVKTKREPKHLSTSTCQQLYLSLRIALLMEAENVGRHIPILADDILVNFDETRRVCAAKALVELSKVRQVLFFTCHEDVAKIMQDVAEDACVIEL